ncbi:putative long-chain-fatty-acid--[acyl-carrier-protein] ligase [Rosa chinensis]|uniref:Putative long-chain-fatty-acid--[acyl-carrier-protein] ligase n=1 Tax=Rosa chinensis TaxID=74649 RepID=A0A2P6QU99_ROSCH|nr:putative long-chain-fatty-acid--[acyl-carrier-protein] ligase [Rosa chinensis]
MGARIVAAILWPLHVLGTKLVYSKIHSAIGISKVISLTFWTDKSGYFSSLCQLLFIGIDFEIVCILRLVFVE